MPLPPLDELFLVLSRAHKLLWRAWVVADLSSQDTMAEDLSGLLIEVERLQYALVSRPGRLRTRPGHRAYQKEAARRHVQPSVAPHPDAESEA